MCPGMSGEVRCACGARANSIVAAVMRERTLRLTFYRCTRCHQEWTVREEGADPAEPVNADEVTAAHEVLQREDLHLEELL